MYLLDTNHCSKILEENSAVLNKLRENSEEGFGISVITRGELIFMVEKSEKKAENLSRVSEFIEVIDIYTIDAAIADCYGRLKGKVLKHFAPKKDKVKRSKVTIQQLGFGDNDLWIAATAISKNVTIVSADKDFLRIQEVMHLSLENWCC